MILPVHTEQSYDPNTHYAPRQLAPVTNKAVVGKSTEYETVRRKESGRLWLAFALKRCCSKADSRAGALVQTSLCRLVVGLSWYLPAPISGLIILNCAFYPPTRPIYCSLTPFDPREQQGSSLTIIESEGEAQYPSTAPIFDAVCPAATIYAMGRLRCQDLPQTP